MRIPSKASLSGFKALQSYTRYPHHGGRGPKSPRTSYVILERVDVLPSSPGRRSDAPSTEVLIAMQFERQDIQCLAYKGGDDVK
jgi:hypothetical protein